MTEMIEPLAVELALQIEAGTTFSLPLEWLQSTDPDVAVDITGYTAIATFAADNNDDSSPLLTLTEQDGLTLGGAAGTIQLDLTLARVNALPPFAWWNLVLTSADESYVRRLVQGPVYIIPDLIVSS